jgi:signal transduction histidine kinase
LPQIQIDLPSQLPPLPAAVEVAAFRLVQEGLHNVIQHAQASTCLIRLACPNERALAIEIIDDGVGLPAASKAGVGLHSMRERASELGGVWAIERLEQRGTRVSAWLPIAPISWKGIEDEPATHSYRR